MEHTARIIEKKKLADGQIAVLMQCCDDPSTNSWHTLSITKDTTTDEVSAWVADAEQHVQDSHSAAQAVDLHLESLITV